MKHELTITQVTENLQRLFPGKDIKCIDIVRSWDGSQFYIETNVSKIVVNGKMIWVKPDIRSWAQYIIYCKDWNKMYQKLRTAKFGTCIPFIFLPAKQSKKNKEYSELLLIACGLKTKKTKDEDISRLQQFKAPFYVECYKLIKQIQVIESSLQDETICDRWGNERGHKLMLSVTHTTGNFKFPIETGYTDQDEQIANIFLNLLGKPVMTKVTESIAA
jgi:hypothetical protein